MKNFIITVDTEGDDLWHYHNGQNISTRNAAYIHRFQDMCQKFGFKPVYLTNYEMISCDEYVRYVRDIAHAGLCEVGIHIHAWNNPPLYKLDKAITDNPYLIEYPEEVMREKFSVTYNLICEKIGIPPVSHRAGRWAMNDSYFQILKEFNILVDCSHTPHIDWSHNMGAYVGGSDYRSVSEYPTIIRGVLEVPVTVYPSRELNKMNLIDTLYHIWKFKSLPYKKIWLRPAQASLEDMIKMVEIYSSKPQYDYLEFMIHSSELMPGGSPYFSNQNEVDYLYEVMEKVFSYAKKMKYEGITLKDYYIRKMKSNE